MLSVRRRKLSELLARIRNVVALSRPAAPSAARVGFVWRLAGRVRMPSARLFVVLGMSALPVGVAVNALFLQRERHPAPLFAPSRSKESSASSIAVSSSTLKESHAADEIGDLLRGEPQGEASRLVLAAQSALAKLGYAVKPDGAFGSATQQALRDFERAHGLPLTMEITPHLLKQLASAARAVGR